jgi:hypothetical protein
MYKLPNGNIAQIGEIYRSVIESHSTIEIISLKDAEEEFGKDCAAGDGFVYGRVKDDGLMYIDGYVDTYFMDNFVFVSAKHSTKELEAVIKNLSWENGTQEGDSK